MAQNTQNTMFNKMMNSKDFHIVLDDTTPIGGIKFVSTSGDEVIVYPDGVDKKIEKIKESAVAEEEKEETIVAEEKEDTAMKKTTTKHNGLGRLIAKRAIKAAMKASYGSGFGIGYATTTVKEEVAYAMHKVASTRTAQAFVSGYYNGKADADYAFIQRVRRREEKAREKAEAKAAREAAEELFDEFTDEDFDF